MEHSLKEKEKKKEKEEREEKKPKQLFKPPRWEEKPTFEKIEVKRLSEDDYDDVIALLRRNQIFLTPALKNELKRVLALHHSYGAYVERALVGVVIAFPVGFNPSTKEVGQGSNALYMEEVVIAPGFESRGVEERLIEEIEKDNRGKYVISLVDENVPEGGLVDYIREKGTHFSKLLLERGYDVVRHPLGILAFRLV